MRHFWMYTVILWGAGSEAREIDSRPFCFLESGAKGGSMFLDLKSYFNLSIQCNKNP